MFFYIPLSPGAGAEVLAGAEGGVLGRDHQGGEEGLRAAQVVIRPGQPPCGSIVYSDDLNIHNYVSIFTVKFYEFSLLQL